MRHRRPGRSAGSVNSLRAPGIGLERHGKRHEGKRTLDRARVEGRSGKREHCQDSTSPGSDGFHGLLDLAIWQMYRRQAPSPSLSASMKVGRD